MNVTPRRNDCEPLTLVPTVVFKEEASCTVIHGDSRKELAEFAGKVALIVTSPPSVL